MNRFLLASLLLCGCITPPHPEPTPGPGPSPQPPVPAVGKISVLIVEETEDRTRLPAAQNNALFAKSVRDYLDSHCGIGLDGKTPEWRLWDKDVNATNESVKWQDGLAAWRSAPRITPWIMISNGATGTEGPFPATEADTLELLKKWGGN